MSGIDRQKQSLRGGLISPETVILSMSSAAIFGEEGVGGLAMTQNTFSYLLEWGEVNPTLKQKSACHQYDTRIIESNAQEF